MNRRSAADQSARLGTSYSNYKNSIQGNSFAFFAFDTQYAYSLDNELIKEEDQHRKIDHEKSFKKEISKEIIKIIESDGQEIDKVDVSTPFNGSSSTSKNVLEMESMQLVPALKDDKPADVILQSKLPTLSLRRSKEIKNHRIPEEKSSCMACMIF